MKIRTHIAFMIFISGSLLFSESCKLLQKKADQPNSTGTNKQINFDDYFIDACTQFGNGNYTLSIKNLEQCLRLNSSEASVYYQLSKNYYELSDQNLSLQNAMKAYNLAPNNSYYGLWYAEKLSESGNIKDAIKVLEKTFIKNPKDEIVLKALDALLIQNLNPIQDRINIWLKHKSIAGYKLNSSLKLIELHVQVKNYAAAHLLYDEIKTASPLKYKYFIDDANLYLLQNDEIHAFENFQKAIALNPNNFNLNYSLFKLKAAKNQTSEACAFLLTAFADPLTSLDIKLDICKEINKKIEDDSNYLSYIKVIAENLVKLYPENPESLLTSANYFEKCHLYAEALKHYSKINELRPGMFDAWLGSLKMTSELKQHQMTIDIANKALEYYPDVAKIYLEASKACISIKEYNKALEFSRSGLSFAFDPLLKSGLLMAQATSSFKLSLIKDAETILLEALSINDKEADIFELLGDVYYKLNKTEMALENWQKALSLGSTSTVLNKKIKDEKYFDQ